MSTKASNDSTPAQNYYNLGYSGDTTDSKAASNKAAQHGSDESNGKVAACGTKEAANGTKDTVVTNPQVVEGEEEEFRCGYFGWEPECLQINNNPKSLLATMSWYTFVQGFVVNGINYVNATTLERRFDLRSSQVAWIFSSYDLCAGILAPIYGYIGIFSHIGRVLAVSAVMMGFGSLIFVLPHIIAGPYEYGTTASQFCDPGSVDSTCSDQGSNLSNFLFLFIIGQILHGIGGTAIFTLGVPYLDSNIRTVNTPVYIGIMMAFSALGPAFGFIFGGLFLLVYVDVLRVDMNDVVISAEDPRWVGAWWIGYIIGMFSAWTLAFIVACYPRELPVAKIYRAERASQTYKGSGDEETASKTFGLSGRDVLYSLKLVFTNPTWIFLTVAGIVESGAVIAFAAFLPKVIQFQFAQSPTMAAVWSGLLTIVGATGGHLLGGVIPQVMKLRLRGLLAQCLICSLIGVALSAIFLLRCEMPSIAGVTVPYFNSSYHLDSGQSHLDHSCNSNCSCTTTSYDPLCGVDNLDYFSPCYAGCVNSSVVDGVEQFYDCGCIATSNSSAGSGPAPSSDASTGICPQDCGLLYVFLPLFFVLILVTFVSSTAGQAAAMRCIPDKERSFSFGVQSCLVRFLGNVPGPLILGAIFDSACYVWQDKCGTQGSCWIYDSESLAFGITIACAVVKGISSLGFFLSLVLYKPPPPPPPPPVTNSIEKHPPEQLGGKGEQLENTGKQAIVEDVFDTRM